jgi:hypothetical protein
LVGPSPIPSSRCQTAGPDLGERWPSRMVATPSADRVSITRWCDGRALCSRECLESWLRLRCTCPLHQPGIADSMICQAIQPASSKSPRNTKKHPTTPTVLLSCQFLTSPSRSDSRRAPTGTPPDPWQPHALALLRARRERPSSYRAADERDEVAPPHSITSSAKMYSCGGIVTPSASAVLRLITNLNSVGCSIGKSAGLAPLKILST